MSKHEKVVLGNWIQATGTIISAVANTPDIPISANLKQDFKVIGNTLQATGNAIQVEKLTLRNLNNIANEIQAVGNTLEIASLMLPIRSSDTLSSQGDLLQALGSVISFSEEWKKERTIEVLYLGIGNLLQAIGNSLQALATRSKSNATILNTIGNWIQATGAVMTAIGASIDP
ncbi:DUF6944 family repetitive protein [Paraliobacillus ryukyuensis]|uniref:DUF6944 family repetitive protein n=1 Tax=Paraliobacillus ryukyuensis TaxID=200904 RepID=UPI0009A718B5|nr:hypothetical protein [Paraliobacillus ryukyuensis]